MFADPILVTGKARLNAFVGGVLHDKAEGKASNQSEAEQLNVLGMGGNVSSDRPSLAPSWSAVMLLTCF